MPMSWLANRGWHMLSTTTGQTKQPERPTTRFSLSVKVKNRGQGANECGEDGKPATLAGSRLWAGPDRMGAVESA